MAKFLIRNDDVNFDTNIDEIRQFCEICNKYGYKVIQAITPIGECRKSSSTMTNEQIRLASFKRFDENTEVVEYLKSRKDLIGVHGLWHTHKPDIDEIQKGKEILVNLGFNPTYFVPPFNEGEYPSEIAGLTTCKLSFEKGDLLETFLKRGTPASPIMYLHSSRFQDHKFGCSFERLDSCLKRLSASPFRLWYNNWVAQNAKGDVLDIGKSRYWDYGFPTLDTNSELNPTYVGSIEATDFDSETFDVVLCNGMYEFVEDPQAMIDEALRITKKGGKAIFGFVGKGYKPYKKPWKFYQGHETLPPHTREDFGNEYHFFIVEK